MQMLAFSIVSRNEKLERVQKKKRKLFSGEDEKFFSNRLFTESFSVIDVQPSIIGLVIVTSRL